MVLYLFISSTTLTVTGLKGQSFDIVKKETITSTGLKNDTTRNLIAETTYYTRGHNSVTIFVDTMYDKERVSGTVYTGRPTSWTGKVALAYLSDYGYVAGSGSADDTWVVRSSGYVHTRSIAYGARGVTPVLSLSSELDIGSGTGTSSSPYQLSV